MVPYTRSQSRLLKTAGSRSGMRWADVWATVRYILSCLAQSLFKLWDLNPVSLVLRRWRQLHHMNTLMALSIRPRLIDLATDFFLSDDRRKRKLLSWVKSILPWVGEDVFDFTACWQDGIVLCSLIEAIHPGACPRFGQLKPHHRVNNCRLGLQLATQYLKVAQLPLCPEEMAIADERTEVKICHLVQMLKWKYQKQGSKPTVFSIFSIDEPLPCKCQAKGTGIRAGIVGRRAKFNILTETTTRLDLDIEIRGPNNEYNKEKIVSVDTGTPLPYRNQRLITTASVSEDDGKSKIIEDGAGHSFLRQKSMEEDLSHLVIPFDYQCVGEGRFLVTYIPRNAGLHYITVLSGGVHIPGSPFEVKVSDWVSSWNVVPKSRVVPFDMMHSVEERQTDEADVPKAATTKVKRQLSQVAHMSKQLTRMKRRILRKVITANGEEIICDVIPALTRQKSADFMLIEDDRHELEAIDQADNDMELSSFKYLQDRTVSDDGTDVNDNSNPRTERATQDEVNSWMVEHQVKNGSMTPTIVVTHDDDCDDPDVHDVSFRDDINFGVLDQETDDLQASGNLDSFEHVFLNERKRGCLSQTSMPPMRVSPRIVRYRSFDETKIRTDLEISYNDCPAPSYSSRTRTSPGSRRSSYSECPSSVPQNSDFPGAVLDNFVPQKKDCTSPVHSNTVRSMSTHDTCLQRASTVSDESVRPAAVSAGLESSMSPTPVPYDMAGWHGNKTSCASIVASSCPSSQRPESLPGFSLLQISPSKEGCMESGSREIVTLNQTDNPYIVDSVNPQIDNPYIVASGNPQINNPYMVDSGNPQINNPYTVDSGNPQTNNQYIVDSGNSQTNNQYIVDSGNPETDNPYIVVSGNLQADNPYIVDSGNPEENGSSSSPQSDTNHVNDCICCHVDSFTDKEHVSNRSDLDTRIHGDVENGYYDTASSQHQIDVPNTVDSRDLNACNTPKDTTSKSHFNGKINWLSKVSSGVKTDHWCAVHMSSSFDCPDFHSDVGIKSPLNTNLNAGQQLKKSWSDPYTADHLDGKECIVSPEMMPAASMVHLNNPHTGQFSARPETGSDAENGCQDMDTNQYKIEILNSDGLSRPYFCFRDGINCNDKTRKDLSAYSKQITENQNENTSEQCLMNGKCDGTVSVRTSSGDGSANSKTWSFSDVDRISQRDGRHGPNHVNETTCEEPYQDEDEILHIVIVPKKIESDNEDCHVSNPESCVYTKLSIQTNDNLPVLENNSECLSVPEKTPDLGDETVYQMTREQMEEINGVSPFSDVSNKSGNSDWSDIDDACRGLSENHKSTSRYFLKGDWSPQFVELNYQGGVKSRRRSSTRSACSLSPANCSHRTKHGITSLLDVGNTDTNRTKPELEDGIRVPHHIRDTGGNENQVEVYTSGSNLRGKSTDGDCISLQEKLENNHDTISKPRLSENVDHYQENTNVEATCSDGCKLYLRRRRRPVYIHECSLNTCIGKDDVTIDGMLGHPEDIDDINSYFTPRPQQKNNAEFTPLRMPKVGTFFSKMELLSPDLSDCLPVDNWSSLNNSWVRDPYKQNTYCPRSVSQRRQGCIPSCSPHEQLRCYTELFQERTLTPTKYREREHVSRYTQSTRDQEKSRTVNSRFSDTQFGHEQKRGGIARHQGCVPDAGSAQLVRTPGDKCLTPTKYRMQTARGGKQRDQSHLLIPCKHDSDASVFHTNSPVSDEAQELIFEDWSFTTQAQKQGLACRHNTHIMDSNQPNSNNVSSVSQIRMARPSDNGMDTYSAMKRGFPDNGSNLHEELQDACVWQPCLCDLCVIQPQDQTDGNRVRMEESKMRKTLGTAKENTESISDITDYFDNTNNNDGNNCQMYHTDSLHFSSETDLENGLRQQLPLRQQLSLWQQQPPRQQLPHQKSLSENARYSSHNYEIQNAPQFQIPQCRNHQHHHHQQSRQQHKNEKPSSHQPPPTIQQPNPDLRVGKLQYFELRYLQQQQQEEIQRTHDGLREEEHQQTPAEQAHLSEHTADDIKGSHRFGMRRQSTVETMDSGITEGSHFSSQQSYADTADVIDLPGFGDDDFHMRLFLAMA